LRDGSSGTLPVWYFDGDGRCSFACSTVVTFTPTDRRDMPGAAVAASWGDGAVDIGAIGTAVIATIPRFVARLDRRYVVTRKLTAAVYIHGWRLGAEAGAARVRLALRLPSATGDHRCLALALGARGIRGGRQPRMPVTHALPLLILDGRRGYWIAAFRQADAPCSGRGMRHRSQGERLSPRDGDQLRRAGRTRNDGYSTADRCVAICVLDGDSSRACAVRGQCE